MNPFTKTKSTTVKSFFVKHSQWKTITKSGHKKTWKGEVMFLVLGVLFVVFVTVIVSLVIPPNQEKP